ncbi:MAG: bifunctional dTDP-4-dehydrorhamnose 3,5-epimerase family protein/NAD(P)-dependent oxidoreductase [Candidatus Saccharibacteria bacterium]
MSESLTNLEFSKKLTIEKTPIPGMLIVDIPVHGDSRGWFKENWQREKMIAQGLPDFQPVQNNISFNAGKGVTRGIHAEPWDKYVSVGAGKIFGAWVDLREGDSFGAVFTAELDPTKAIYVPRGVGNSFQALEDNTVYTYLVNDHWTAEAQGQYTFLNLADEAANIQWPIPLDHAELSDKDKAHPQLANVNPMPAKKTLIVGAYGQLGRALKIEFPHAEDVDRDTLDVSSKDVLTAKNWSDYGTIINAAAYTAVDMAETPEGRRDAWAANATAVSYLANIAIKHNITLIHVSTDYVFDGTATEHFEDEKFSPLSVYGESKAAGDIAAAMAPKYYITRTSWVIGDGNNFAKTMKSLAEKGVRPSVVDDQIGRLTFTSDLARGIKHLLDIGAAYGTYNLTNDGESVSWADIAANVYEQTGHERSSVTGVSTAEYYKDKEGIAPRPLQSSLNLDKIKATGFTPREWKQALREYLDQQ